MPQAYLRRPVSYILRVWVPGNVSDGTESLRYMVERVGGEGRRYGFDSFAALVAHLRAELLDEDGTTPGAAGGAEGEAR